MNPVDPHLFVIFGATGDLTSRKLIPSIFRVLTEDGVRSQRTTCSACLAANGPTTSSAVRPMNRCTRRVRRRTRRGVVPERVFYEPRRGSTRPRGLRSGSSDRSRLGLPGNRVFYLALPPGAFPA